MIRFALLCDKDHEFDGWFKDSAAFDQQAGDGEIACPYCGSTTVSKGLMAPNIAAKSNRKVTAAAAAPDAADVVETFRKMREYVQENSDYVGDKFAEEARRIHYDEADARSIYGEATIDDARELNDEGIDVLPLPALPEDQN